MMVQINDLTNLNKIKGNRCIIDSLEVLNINL